MADQAPLNLFKTEARTLTTNYQTLYTTPLGKTSIVLGAQATNIDGVNPITVSFVLTKNAEDFVLLDAFTVPIHDAAELTTGKLVIEQGCSVKAKAGSNNAISVVLSLLETSNE